FDTATPVRTGLVIFLGIDALWLGLVTYATYDLTNFAVQRQWPMLVTAVDLGWGTVLIPVTSALSV
ncbi:MAG TPA: DUF2177 family protein, partial [Anaerolineales bacterium]|nr:DUF2177 family protein [Anaerolineales bacterium]